MFISGDIFTKCLSQVLGLNFGYKYSHLKPERCLKTILNTIPGPVFMKGLRLSQVLGLNVVLKLRLLSQLSFVLKSYLKRVT